MKLWLLILGVCASVVALHAQEVKKLPYYYRSALKLELEAVEESTILDITFHFKKPIGKKNTGSRYPDSVEMLLLDESDGRKLLSRGKVKLVVSEIEKNQYFASLKFVCDDLNIDLQEKQRVKLHLVIIDDPLVSAGLSFFLETIQVPSAINVIGKVRVVSQTVDPVLIMIDPKTINVHK